MIGLGFAAVSSIYQVSAGEMGVLLAGLPNSTAASLYQAEGCGEAPSMLGSLGCSIWKVLSECEGYLQKGCEGRLGTPSLVPFQLFSFGL